MRIHYQDIGTGKRHYTDARRGYKVVWGEWLGKRTPLVVVTRKSDELIIPPWCLLPGNEQILDECNEVWKAIRAEG